MKIYEIETLASDIVLRQWSEGLYENLLHIDIDDEVDIIEQDSEDKEEFYTDLMSVIAYHNYPNKYD